MELHATVVKVGPGCVAILEAPQFIRCTKSYRIFNIHLHMLGNNRKARGGEEARTRKETRLLAPPPPPWPPQWPF